MKLEEIRKIEAQRLLPTYDRTPVHFVGGSGVWLRDENGVEYLDLLSGIGVNALGYGHPAIEKAIADQSKKLLHISNLFYHDGQARLAEKLASPTGLDRAFFCNSGTEAWEAALKLARAYSQLRRREGHPAGTKYSRWTIPSTVAPWALSRPLTNKNIASPSLPSCPASSSSAGMMSPICTRSFRPKSVPSASKSLQGEGGLRRVSPEFLQAARELTEQSGSLLLLDEIQSGIGRTGDWCAYQHYGVKPDMTTLAKPLAGGLPLGALLCTNEVARAMEPGLHGTTFGGGPLACAVALAVFKTIEDENLLAHVREVGAYFENSLQELKARHDAIVEVRGRGLMLGLELNDVEVAKAVAAEMLAQKIIINRTSDVVLRFLPPFLIQEEHVDRAIEALDAALSKAREPALTGGVPHGN